MQVPARRDRSAPPAPAVPRSGNDCRRSRGRRSSVSDSPARFDADVIEGPPVDQLIESDEAPQDQAIEQLKRGIKIVALQQKVGELPERKRAPYGEEPEHRGLLPRSLWRPALVEL